MGGYPEHTHVQSPQKGLRALLYSRKENAYEQVKAFAESRKTTAKKTIRRKTMKPFTFYDIYYAPIKALDDKFARKFFRMICDFLDGKLVSIDAESDAEISPEFELYCHFKRSGNVPQLRGQKLRAGQAVQTFSVFALLSKALYLSGA